MRFATYNIRHGQGVASLPWLPRTARAMAGLQADAIAVNEVYDWWGPLRQPDRLAKMLGMNMLFQANTVHGPAKYGNAILSKWPLSLRLDLKLPTHHEPRGSLVADLEVGALTACFAVTHLALHRETRAQQVATMARELPRGVPLVLAGDFNASIGELGPLLEFLSAVPDAPNTYPSVRPLVTVDHILFSEHWMLRGSGVVRSLASDHLPVYADLELVR